MAQADYQALADSVAQAHGIPPALFSSLISHESGWNRYAVSMTGDVGLGQINSKYFADYGLSGYGDAFDPTKNLNASATGLSKYYAQFGNWYDALRAYNAGPTGATNDPKISGGYANLILEDAGMSNSPNTGTATPGALNDTGSGFLGDPWGYMTGKLALLWEKIKPMLWVIGAILLIALLAYFGVKKVVTE